MSSADHGALPIVVDIDSLRLLGGRASEAAAAGESGRGGWVDSLSGALSGALAATMQQELHDKMREQREWLRVEFAELREELGRVVMNSVNKTLSSERPTLRPSNRPSARPSRKTTKELTQDLDVTEPIWSERVSIPEEPFFLGASEAVMDMDMTPVEASSTHKSAFDAELERISQQAAQFRAHDNEWQGSIREVYLQKSRLPRNLRGKALEELRKTAPSLSSHNNKSLYYRIVKHKQFEVLVMILILIDASYTGFYTDYELRNQFDKMRGHADDPMRSSQYVFAGLTVFFAVELVMRILAMRGEFLLGDDWQTGLLDTALVAASMPSLFDETSPAGMVLRVLRVGRVFKLTVLMRSLHLFPSLRIMVRSIYSTGGLLVWALVMMFIAIYLFSLFFMVVVRVNFLQDPVNLRGQATGQAESDRREWALTLFKYFGSVDTSMWTLYYVITGGVDWGEVVAPLEGISYFLKPIFGLYMFGMLFGIMSILVGLFCDKAAAISNLDQEMMVTQNREEKESLIAYMTDIFHQMDPDDSGEVTWPQFRDFMQREECQDFFAAKGLNILDARALFQLLDDIDGDPNGSMDLGSFLQGMVRICGPAKNAETLQVLYEQRKNQALLMQMVREMHAQELKMYPSQR